MLRHCLCAIAFAGLTVTTSQAQPARGPGSDPPPLALTFTPIERERTSFGRDRTVYSSLRYRRPPREQTSDRGSGSADGYMQIQGGVFDPAGDVSNSAMFSARLGTNFEDRVQLGGQLDWSHRADHQTEVVGSGTLPGGDPVERRRELSSVSSDLVPLMGFLQVAPMGTHAGPYFGVAGGYQALFVTAQDFSTGQDFDATYDGWGWQAYAGFAFPMSRVSRLTVEAFTNAAELDRDVQDALTGVTYREVVDAGGSGIRGGVSWSF